MRPFITDTLRKLEPEIPYSENAVNLILGTIAQESAFGKYRRQLGNGPALGIIQMEPATFRDIVKNYLRYHHEIADKIKALARVNEFNAIDLLNNDRLAVSMCRVHYLRCKGAIPATVKAQAKYWKIGYNTVLGKGTEEEFIKNYAKYVATG